MFLPALSTPSRLKGWTEEGLSQLVPSAEPHGPPSHRSHARPDAARLPLPGVRSACAYAHRLALLALPAVQRPPDSGRPLPGWPSRTASPIQRRCRPRSAAPQHEWLASTLCGAGGLAPDRVTGRMRAYSDFFCGTMFSPQVLMRKSLVEKMRARRICALCAPTFPSRIAKDQQPSPISLMRTRVHLFYPEHNSAANRKPGRFDVTRRPAWPGPAGWRLRAKKRCSAAGQRGRA